MKTAITSLAITLLIGLTSFQANAQEKQAINWMTWEEVEAAMQVERKKIFVDVYTHWCGPCKMFSATTLKDPDVVSFVNENFYAIKFNAETPDTIVVGGNTYVNPSYNPAAVRKGTHQLSYALGVRSYPTTLYFDENFNLLTSVPGAIKKPMLMMVLSFFHENAYLEMEWPDYQKSYTTREQ